MATLDQRYEKGRQIRNAVLDGLPGQVAYSGFELAPDLGRIVDEALYGSIWQRPALGIYYFETLQTSPSP